MLPEFHYLNCHSPPDLSWRCVFSWIARAVCFSSISHHPVSLAIHNNFWQLIRGVQGWIGPYQLSHLIVWNCLPGCLLCKYYKPWKERCVKTKWRAWEPLAGWHSLRGEEGGLASVCVGSPWLCWVTPTPPGKFRVWWLIRQRGIWFCICSGGGGRVEVWPLKLGCTDHFCHNSTPVLVNACFSRIFSHYPLCLPGSSAAVTRTQQGDSPGLRPAAHSPPITSYLKMKAIASLVELTTLQMTSPPYTPHAPFLQSLLLSVI